jgi:hypothetical protein
MPKMQSGVLLMAPVKVRRVPMCGCPSIVRTGVCCYGEMPPLDALSGAIPLLTG